ncbi:MAG: hypothetical protein N2746_01425, partial [Deltaproteobacteria bacterium]|nr:hypothetical protein [Deltaproteobacteria bacterium]
ADNNTLYTSKKESISIIKRFVKNLDIPIHTILTGDDNNYNDISVKILTFSPIGFIGREFEITVRISNNSQFYENIPLTIKEDGVPLFSSTHKVPIGSIEDINLKIYPRKTGRNIYEVSAQPLINEENAENNRDFFYSKIKKENIRILQIAGAVSYDVRFLRHFFKKAPNIDLISFFILRTIDSDVNAPDSELSLIPFPTDKIIKENLNTFDLIVFQDFGFVPYGLSTTFSDINKFVRKGGALIFITGNNWYKWIGDFITFFKECMPATPQIDDNAIENIIYKPELTLQGKIHPITRILPSQEENNLLFKNLPELHGVHRIKDIKPDTIILMAAKANEDLPLLLLNRCEKGKTALVTTDELWRLSFSEKTPDEFNLYNKLMNNLILWLTGEPDKEDIVITPSRNRRTSDELRGKLYGIITEKNITMQTGDGTMISGSIEQDGEFFFDISKIPEGTHKAKILYHNQVFDLSFYKKNTDIEMIDTAPKPEILKSMAKYSGGKHFQTTKNLKELKLAKRPVKKIQNTTTMPLWNKGVFLALLLLLFFSEWFFRRIFGHQ